MAWDSGRSSNDVHGKLKKCISNLISWRNFEYNKEKQNNRKLLAKLDIVQANGSGEHQEENQAIQTELQLNLTTEEIKWKQIAKQHWLQRGDKNTRFYHMCANQRRKTNRISAIQDPYGNLVIDPTQIGVIFSNFFSNLFTSSSPQGIDQCLASIICLINFLMRITRGSWQNSLNKISLRHYS